MEDNSAPNEKRVPLGRLFLPSLAMSFFATSPLTVLVSLLLVDIAATFNVDVSVMGQINTPFSVVAVIFALLMGILSVRFKHKSLLLIGLLFFGLSALGCFLAPDYSAMLISYALSGVGWAMVSPMVTTLIGEHYPLEKRANAVGWIVASGASAWVIGAPVIALIAGVEGWRFALLGFVIPISLASLLLAFNGLPSTSHSSPSAVNKEAYLRSFKRILSNRSAIACLVGDLLRSAAFVAVYIYVASFVRQRFSASTDFASIVILSAALCYALGSVFGGRLVTLFGRKPSTVLTALLAGVFTISYAYVPNLWLSLALIFVACWFYGLVVSAASCLTLEQVPEFRGTMMSIDTAAINLGAAVGTAIGGAVLLSFNYEGLGSALGVMGIVAAVVFYFLAVDPTKT